MIQAEFARSDARIQAYLEELHALAVGEGRNLSRITWKGPPGPIPEGPQIRMHAAHHYFPAVSTNRLYFFSTSLSLSCGMAIAV